MAAFEITAHPYNDAERADHVYAIATDRAQAESYFASASASVIVVEIPGIPAGRDVCAVLDTDRDGGITNLAGEA